MDASRRDIEAGISLAVHLILINDNMVLLSKRKNTGVFDGSYGVIAGHLEEGETATTAIVREIKEECNIAIKYEDVCMAHVMYRKASEMRVDFFFTAKKWTGDVVNNEPNKCEELHWFPICSLPENVVPYMKSGIHKFEKGITFSEFGWD